MKRTILLIIAISASIHSFTQTTLNFRTTMFNNLTTSKLSTNVLANKAGMPDPIFGFNGNSTCDASTYDLWQYAYQTLYVGFVGTPTYPTPETIRAQVPNSPASEIKVNGLYYKYNHLADNAVSSGLIHLTDTLFYDGPNSGNPYLEKNCVAVSPMFPAEVPLSVSFRGGAIYVELENRVHDNDGVTGSMLNKAFELISPDNVAIENITINNQSKQYEAANNITLENVTLQNNSTLNIRAGQSISIDRNFKVNVGSIFKATIQPFCE